MKKILKAIFIILLMILCCSCAPGLKNMKEVDCYIEKERTSTTQQPFLEITSPLQTRVGVDDVITFPFSLVSILKPSGLDRKGNVTAYIPLSVAIHFQRYVAYYRKEPGKPAWDLRDEALKKVGPRPERPSCEIKHFSIEPILGFNKEYDFGDSQINVSKGLLFQLHFKARKGAEPPCNRTDLEAYLDYVSKVVNIFHDYVNEESSRPSGLLSGDCK